VRERENLIGNEWEFLRDKSYLDLPVEEWIKRKTYIKIASPFKK
jgi:hypothetical protein